MWNQGKPGTRKEYFPLPEDAKKFEARFATIRADHHKAAVEVLRKVEPWRNKLLKALREMDNTDKHEMPILAAAVQDELRVKLPPDLELNGQRNVEIVTKREGHFFIEHGTDLAIGVGIVTDDGPLTELESVLAVDIAFGRRELLEGKLVLATLEEAAKLVEGIADQFLGAGLLK